MKLSLDTRYNIFDEVEYKYVDVWEIFDGEEPKEKIKRSAITFIEIQVGSSGYISVKYGMDNEDLVCSDAIISCLNE